MNNKISNIIGVPIPQWLVEQFRVRSDKGSHEQKRDVQELQFLANKTAWVRMVSSVQISGDDNRYFSKFMKDEKLIKFYAPTEEASLSFSTSVNSLAKNFILFAGTSKYQKIENTFSNELRSGISNGAYGMLGEEEVNRYGYVPMPGITSVDIQTMGRMGSIRSSTVNFKAFNKLQLDIIEALYFKLGYTMLLEWGHAFYYESEPNVSTSEMKLRSTEDLMIDPFLANLSKEKINYQIALNVKKSYGNYDGMLGVVTNFNFSRAEDGSYDCSVKLIGLGAIAESLNIARATIFNDLIKDEIKKIVDTANQKIEDQRLEQQKSKLERIEALKKEKEEIEKTKQEKLTINEIYEKKIEEKNKNLPANVKPYTLSNFLYTPANSTTALYDKNTADVVYQDDKSWAIRKFGIILKEGISQIGTVTLNSTALSQFLISRDSFSKREPDFGNRNLGGDIANEEYLKTALFGLFRKEYDFYNIPYKKNFDDNIFAYSKETTSLGLVKTKSTLRRTITIAIKSPSQTELTDLSFITNIPADIKDYISNKLEIPTVNNILRELYRQKVYDALTSGDKNNSTYTSNGSIFEIGTTFKIDKINLSDYALKTITEQDSTNYLDRQENERYYPVLLLRKTIDSVIDFAVIISDSAFIENITVFDPQESKEFFDKDQAVQDKNSQKETEIQRIQAEIADIEASLPKIDALKVQNEEAGKYASSIEVALRTIQIYSLNTATQKNQDVVKVDFLQNQQKLAKSIFKEVGLYSKYYDKIVNNTLLDIEDYGNSERILSLSDDELLEFYIKYGFNVNVLSNNHVTFNDASGTKGLEKIAVDHKELLASYVVPYQVSQDFSQGIKLERPVYIKFGTLLMLINHLAIMYDSNEEKSKNKRPFFYVDYNPNTNFCLTCLNHLTTNPFNFLIPYAGKDSDVEKLFSSTILDDVEFKKEKLFKPSDNPSTGDARTSNGDALSKYIPEFIEDGANGKLVYRGKVMNILIEIDYLLNTIKRFSKNDGTNSVYFKPFIDNILSDICKYLGNFNLLRLAYNDAGNCFHIVDDQLVPPDSKTGERELLRTGGNSTQYEIPLYGKNSIAKTLEIKTDISSKLSNLIALSANSEKYQGEMSTDSTSFGFINKNFRDRYIVTRGDINSEDINNRKKDEANNTNGDITSAVDFNKAIKAFYGQIDIPLDYVNSSTNYYINRISKIKADDPATRASAIIPVSINFSTDGISGFNMYQSFAVDEELLPYAYTAKNKLDEIEVDRRVGFCVIGVSHTIQNNQWNTSVKSNMIYLRDNSDYLNVSKALNTGAPKSFRNNLPEDDLDRDFSEAASIREELASNFENSLLYRENNKKVKWQLQQDSVWCYIASVSMLLESYGKNKSNQNYIYNNFTDSRSNLNSSAIAREYKVSYKKESLPNGNVQASYDRIVSTIKNRQGKPFILERKGSRGSGSHFVVVLSVDNRNRVVLFDPGSSQYAGGTYLNKDNLKQYGGSLRFFDLY